MQQAPGNQSWRLAWRWQNRSPEVASRLCSPRWRWCRHPLNWAKLKRYVENGEFLIEASDLGVVNMCAERKLPFVAGHALNCYNAVTLKILLKQGMMRWCMPVELSRDWLVNLLNQCDELGIRNQFEVEVLSYGHLPLAYSARLLYRAFGRPPER
ncbi:putative peptidase [Escherichia coli]|uniref:Putative peptidase n=1 Tax=Escherichia coli TaxID=562 RepID=A0A376KMU4_ECOLX|nr:putative peptidase [Escherichia coli]